MGEFLVLESRVSEALQTSSCVLVGIPRFTRIQGVSYDFLFDGVKSIEHDDRLIYIPVVPYRECEKERNELLATALKTTKKHTFAMPEDLTQRNGDAARHLLFFDVGMRQGEVFVAQREHYLVTNNITQRMRSALYEIGKRLRQ